jgi:beta-glucosidase
MKPHLRNSFLIPPALLLALQFFCLDTKAALPQQWNQIPPQQLDAEVDNLIKQMTPEEKVTELLSYSDNAIPRLGIPSLEWAELLHGVLSDGATCFPQAIAMGAMWDPDLMQQIGGTAAMEARSLGIGQALSPMLGIARDPRWGRVEESYGEDPYLVSRDGVAFINGLQGTGADRFSSNHVIATPKHFVADGEPFGGENGEDIETSDRVLREIYFAPFEAAVKEAHAGAIMPAHHAINGVPCHANSWLLQDLLRKEWGFNGFVISDAGDIPKLFTQGGDFGHRYATSPDNAAVRAIEAGVDVELPGDVYKSTLLNSVNSGVLPMGIVDRAVRHVLSMKLRLLGLITPGAAQNGGDKTKQDILNYKGPEDPFAVAVRDGRFTAPTVGRRPDYLKVLNDPIHDKLALLAAEKAIVLLKNQGGLLPLDATKVKNILVVGPLAVKVNLGGYSTSRPKFYVNMVDGIKAAAGPGTQVSFQPGCTIDDPSIEALPAAVAAAANADVIVAVVGQTRDQVGENLDRDNLDLHGGQEKLVEAMQATGKPVVVVLENGAPLTINWINDHVPAIVESWYLGQAAGTAVGEVLFGQVNPGGKLSVSFPRNLGQIPSYYNHPLTTGPLNFYQSPFGPLYPFGFGLSYTSFEYSSLKIDPVAISANQYSSQKATVSVVIRNTGQRAGDEIVQLYTRQDYTSLKRPLKELKGFQRITLQPGESKTVTFTLGWEQLKFWKTGIGWVVEPGQILVEIGASSTDIRQLGVLKVQ